MSIFRRDRVEVLSLDFAMGWAELIAGEPAIIYATLGDAVIGFGEANLVRPDLTKLAETSTLRAAAFVIIYKQPVPAERIGDVQLWRVSAFEPVTRSVKLRLDRTPKLQILVVGSPRSGTSELGSTLATQLDLAWLGEGHAAPLFAAAAISLSGDLQSPNGLIRFMAQQQYGQLPIEAAKRAYYQMHGSASFVDKTPGLPMITALPFLLECFPRAKIIYLQRNAVSNVLSRMTKFGGRFEAHCADWSATTVEWTKIRALLPDYLELRQENMLADPATVASSIANYLRMPDAVAGLQSSLQRGTRERTGAGVGRNTLDQTGWPPQDVATFRRICGPIMEQLGYAM
jgi:hypothetical protein